MNEKKRWTTPKKETKLMSGESKGVTRLMTEKSLSIVEEKSQEGKEERPSQQC